VAEGAGLENRCTRKGIVGSNPTLSADKGERYEGRIRPLSHPPLTAYLSGMLFLAQSLAPGDCLLTGLCGIQQASTGAPPGMLFLALGLVLYGAGGLWRGRRRR
jgi:hypothetical protein